MGSPILKLLLLLSLTANAIFLYGYFKTQGENVAESQNEAEQVVPTEDAFVYESGKSYPLMRVIDGDTIVIGFDSSTQYVRLIGIDSPEPNDPGGPQCYAEEATKHLQELAQTGVVKLYFDESQGMRDSYGRLLAYVEIPDGTDLGKKMIEDGYAHEFTYRAQYERQADYKVAEASAVEEERGLWSPEVCNN